MNLTGKTVLVTGGALRIGRAIVLAFARRGANVLVHYHNSKKEAEDLVREIRRLGVEGQGFAANLSKLVEINRMTEQILKKRVGVDILINNASTFYPTPFGRTLEGEWQDILDVNLKAPYFLSQALAPSMKKKGEGRIINISDISASKPYRDCLPYSLSKSALITLTEGLAKTLAPEILVTAICPGPILAPPGYSAAQKRAIANKTLVGHWGRPEDVAGMVICLAESDFMTGECLRVDGGQFLKG